jgi:hypothetical protein
MSLQPDVPCSVMLDPEDPTVLLVDPLLRAALNKLAAPASVDAHAKKLQAAMPAPERFNIEQAAAVASISPKALRHQIQRGLIPPKLIVHEGRRLFFVASKWREFMSSGKSRGGRAT